MKNMKEILTKSLIDFVTTTFKLFFFQLSFKTHNLKQVPKSIRQLIPCALLKVYMKNLFKANWYNNGPSQSPQQHSLQEKYILVLEILQIKDLFLSTFYKN